jgi:hypothetical protein
MYVFLNFSNRFHNVLHVFVTAKKDLVPEKDRVPAGRFRLRAAQVIGVHGLPVSLKRLGAEVSGQI